MIIVLIIIVGWLAGSLVNYFADILPYYRRPVAPQCHNCGSKYHLGNFLFWPRRCQTCGLNRSRRTWLVEVIAVLATTWLWVSPSDNLNFLLGLILLIYFGTVTLIDLDHRLILHPVSLAGGVLGLLSGIWLHGFQSTLVGGLAGYAIMLLLYLLGNFIAHYVARARGDNLEEVALGFGDVNLSGVLGLMLGWPGILVALFLAILVGGVASLIYMLAMLVTGKYRSYMAVPYGPFLIAGAVTLIYFRDLILAYFTP